MDCSVDVGMFGGADLSYAPPWYRRKDIKIFYQAFKRGTGKTYREDRPFIFGWLVVHQRAEELPHDSNFSVFCAKDIKNISLYFTHDASLALSIEYLQEKKESDILILAIKTYNHLFGETMSEPVKQTEGIIENFFLRNFIVLGGF